MERQHDVTLAAAFDRRLVPGGGGRRFLRLALRAPGAAGDPRRKPLNLAFVLDRSGSMAGEKLDLVKRAVAFGIGQLSAEDCAAVVVYDQEVRTLAASARMTGEAKAAVTLALVGVREGGSTALGEGWLTGCRLAAAMAAELDGRWLTRCLLLTDGLANVGITDPRELTGHATELRRRGVTTSAFGVGADFDERLLGSLAEAGGGNFHFIEHARQIPDFFGGELGELLTVVAEGATVTLGLPAGVGATLLNDYPVTERGAVWPDLHREAPAAQELTIEVGALSADEEKVLIVELDCAAGETGTDLPIAVGLRYHRSADGAARTIAAPPAALRYAPAAEAEAEGPDLTIIEAAGRLQAARAKRAAWEHMTEGRHDAAQGVLRAAARGFAAPMMAAATGALAGDAAELDDLADRAPEGWDSVTRKTARYSSDIVGKGRRDHGKRA